MGRIPRTLTMVALIFGLAACGSAPRASAEAVPSPRPSAASSAPPASTPTAASPIANASADVHLFPVDGHDMWIGCHGTGSPTVILEAGLGANSSIWSGVAAEIEKTSRVCVYDRAGTGASRQRPGNPPTSAGAMAREAWQLFRAAGLDGPLVLVGHSYGGMLVRLVAHDHPEAVRGLVEVDSSSGHQFEGDWLKNDGDWLDGSSSVDREASAKELAAVTSLGSIPLIVLTQGQINGDFEVEWARFQDELAALSSNSLHLIAAKSGHMIMQDDPALLVAMVATAVEAVRNGSSLPACNPSFVALGAECLKTTMTDQLAAWDRARAAVKPDGGSLPDGVYRTVLTAKVNKEVTGDDVDWKENVFTWTLAAGHWSAVDVEDGITPGDTLGDVYDVDGNTLRFRIPTDWKIPRTSGVNELRWTVDATGTLHFTQVDGDLPEPVFTLPWTPVR
jgi:hypothetical protein